MKQLLLTLFCAFGILVANRVNAQSLQKNNDGEQWPPVVVLRSAEQAVANSTMFPAGTYDQYYYVFTFTRGLWKAYVEHYSYNVEPSFLGIETFYFKNNGQQVFEGKKLSN